MTALIALITSATLWAMAAIWWLYLTWRITDWRHTTRATGLFALATIVAVLALRDGIGWSAQVVAHTLITLILAAGRDNLAANSIMDFLSAQRDLAGDSR